MGIYQSMEINIPQSPVGKSGIVVYVGTERHDTANDPKRQKVPFSERQSAFHCPH